MIIIWLQAFVNKDIINLLFQLNHNFHDRRTNHAILIHIHSWKNGTAEYIPWLMADTLEPKQNAWHLEYDVQMYLFLTLYVLNFSEGI